MLGLDAVIRWSRIGVLNGAFLTNRAYRLAVMLADVLIVGRGIVIASRACGAAVHGLRARSWRPMSVRMGVLRHAGSVTGWLRHSTIAPAMPCLGGNVDAGQAKQRRPAAQRARPGRFPCQPSHCGFWMVPSKWWDTL